MGYRHCDPRFPFLWETADQPPARWHALGDGPVQYLADTPDGAWAEFLRHEEITDMDDLAGIERDLWVIEVPRDQHPAAIPELPESILLGGVATYPACRAESNRLRLAGHTGFVAPSAALMHGAASGWRVQHGTLRPGNDRDGRVIVLFGPRPDLRGWRASARGRPHSSLLSNVRPLNPSFPQSIGIIADPDFQSEDAEDYMEAHRPW